MITIDDEQRILNLNYMAIYLMLTPEEIAKYGSKLKELNNYKSLTRGLFRFFIVKKSNTLYEKLPEEMIRDTRNSNLFVRLVNSIHNIYCYGLDYIDLSLEPKTLRNELAYFVDNVCKKNILNLDILDNRITATSIELINRYRKMDMVAELFQRALKKEYFSIKEAIYEKIELYISTTSFTESQSILEAYLVNDKDRIEKDINESNKPSTRPSISVTIKYVPTGKTRKNGTDKKSLGMEYNINGNIVSIPFKSKDQFFLYAAVLLAKRENKQLKREHFTNHVLKENKRWLEKRFAVFAFSESFDDWFEKINRNGKAARINDAKSKINNMLWDVLSPKYKDAYYFCCLFTENPRSNKTCYKINIQAGQIYLDKDMQSKLECIVGTTAS